MMDVLERIRKEAKQSAKRIVLPETDDIRTLHAAIKISLDELAELILIGDEVSIKKLAEKHGLDLPDGIKYIRFVDDKHASQLSEAFYVKRAHKGMTPDAAHKILLKNPLYYAAMLVDAGFADGCVAGAANTTGDVLRAAIQCIGLKKGSSIVSSVFLMQTQDHGVLTYGDCAVVPYPDSNQLASIAVDSAKTHQSLTGETPRVAMLSFSTKGSAHHERIDLVSKALEQAKALEPDMQIDGELQFDAAFVSDVALKKAPGSQVAGKANVFIFPNIDAGNIGYKITERLAGAVATGPIIQGLAKPMNDLSRGCSWMDIVNAACVTALMSD